VRENIFLHLLPICILSVVNGLNIALAFEGSWLFKKLMCNNFNVLRKITFLSYMVTIFLDLLFAFNFRVCFKNNEQMFKMFM
jgi:hypothetical protein